jgi:Arc/MetJ-type ribon-helix-helix transcriptional regulator
MSKGGEAMSVNMMTLELGNVMAISESEVVRKGLLALIEKEIRLAEHEIAEIRERYDTLTHEALLRAIQNGVVVGHPAWEDYIVWKNKESHIARLRQVAIKD